MKNISYTIIESSYIVRKGLVHIIMQFQNTYIVNDTNNYTDIVRRIEKYKSDVVILNINVLDFATINKLKQITYKRSKPLFVGIINREEEAIHNPLIKYWINIKKDKKDIYHLFKTINHSFAKVIEDTNINTELSKQEKRILRLIALGYTNKEIADQLFISPHTAITHRKNITRKLEIKTVSGLTIYAILNNIIDMPEL